MHVNVGSIGHVEGGHPLLRLRSASALAFAIASVNDGKHLYRARQTGKSTLSNMLHNYNRYLEELKEEPVRPIYSHYLRRLTWMTGRSTGKSVTIEDMFGNLLAEGSDYELDVSTGNVTFKKPHAGVKVSAGFRAYRSSFR